MPSNILIVESPAKVKKIQGFLKDQKESFGVESSVGHIRNTNSKALNIDVDNGFKPNYIISPDKKTVVAKLIKLCKGAKTVWLATDPDREGEAIAWHLSEVLKLNKNNRKRISFTQITKDSVCNALKNPGDIDMNMFYSQQARMVIDKIIGYEISPLLWNKFGFIKVGNSYISAGRVVSAVAAIVAKRHIEIEKFSSKSYFQVICDFTKMNGDKKFLIKDTILVGNIETYEETEELMNKIKDKKIKFTVKSGSDNDSCLDKRKTLRRPPPPFITSSLQQEASVKLGLSPKMSMRLAQDLYEGGWITYMRTDSLTMADSALNEIKSYVNRNSNYGNKYHNYIQYKNKGSSTQGGHEACRPVSISKDKLYDDGKGKEFTNRHKKLYQLIWRRAVASQMKPCEVEISTIKINGKDGKKNHVFVGKYEKILFDGWTKLYSSDKQYNENDEEDDNEDIENNENNDKGKNMTSSLEKQFTKLKYGDEVYQFNTKANEKYTKPPLGYFTEASLVKHIEKLGIGRPSTFASAVSNIQDKGYVSKTDKEPVEKTCRHLKLMYSDDKINEELTKVNVGGVKNKLMPTQLGVTVTLFLESKLSEIIDYRFTSKIEELLDKIANGECNWVKVVSNFYKDFKPTVEKLMVKSKAEKKEKQKEKNKSGGGKNESGNSKYSNNIILGKHPETGENVIAYRTKRGPMVCIDSEDPNKKKYAAVAMDINDITLEKACSLLIYPKYLGKYKGEDVKLCKQNNYYLKYGEKNISIDIYEKINKTKIKDKSDLTLDKVKNIIDEFIKVSVKGKTALRKVDANIEILNGPYGYYIKYKKKINIPLPRGKKSESEINKLTDDDIKEIVSNSGKS